MATLGYIGERLDLLIRQGATFGPFDVTLANPDKTPVNLTGATVQAPHWTLSVKLLPS